MRDEKQKQIEEKKAQLSAIRSRAQKGLLDAHRTGDLEKIQKIVRIEGYVHCAEGFRGHPQVLNGASDLVAELFGERGQHTRLAWGINEMPLNAAVQLAMTAEVAD